MVPRSPDESNDAESSRRAPKKFFHVYVDNPSILGTSRVNVDEDLRMAVQTLKSRGLDTHEEIVHSDTAIALGIHIGLRNMLVSVAPMRLWRLKQGLRWALRCRALPGKTREVLLGHVPFVALLRRDVPSVPFALSKFIRANYNDSARLAKCQSRSASFCRSSAGNRWKLDTRLVFVHCGDRVWFRCLFERVQKRCL